MSDEHGVILPVIHLNGSSKEALLEGSCAIGRALRDALGALEEHAPNQRDYYTAPGRWEAAVAQHRRRAEAVRALYYEIERESQGIADL